MTQPSPDATMRTVVLASLGGALEFYDFVAYGIFAEYIAPAFFPAQDELASLVSTFTVFAGGYLIRPLGGVVFSHFGDRFGRRATFLTSLLGISLATFGMAVCPTHQAWGGWATVAFVVLRLLQGFCLGGELPGAVTYVVEAAAPGRTGLACGLLFSCASLGVVLASSVSAGLHALLPTPAMAAYGWRLAFGLGGALGILSYLPRRQLLESPVFALMRERQEVERSPLALVLRRNLGRVAVGFGTTAVVAAFNGILFAYLPAYLVRVALYPAATVATAVTVGLVANAVAVLAAGAMCDLVPARTVHRLGAAAVLLASWPFFRAVADHGTANLAWTLAGFGALGGVASGAFAVVLAGLFPARVRFTGVALAFNASFAVFSGLAPLAAASLVAATGNAAAPGCYLAAVAVVSLIASLGSIEDGGAKGSRTPDRLNAIQAPGPGVDTEWLTGREGETGGPNGPGPRPG